VWKGQIDQRGYGTDRDRSSVEIHIGRLGIEGREGSDLIDLYSDESIVSLTWEGDTRNSQLPGSHSGLVQVEAQYRHRAIPGLEYAYLPDQTPSIRDYHQLKR
jgi:hypothetical protein